MACTSGKSEAQNQFPVGMRVLVVEHDVVSLCVLEEKLRSCMYNVTCCKRGRDALKLLRERKVFFDLVLSEVHMPDMDGFKLVELIGLEMDLPPVIYERRELVMRGVLVGACDYLIKPISDGELKVMWKHVIRKRLNEMKEAKKWDAKHTSKGAVEVLKKRRDDDDHNPVASKKPRVAWSDELHEHFVNAVNLLGIDNALPKRILELMNVPGLTRDNVASHLQRYRVNLKRLSAGLLEPSPTNSEYGFGNDGNHLLLQPNNSDYSSFSPSSASSDGNMVMINSECMQGSTMNSMYAAAATGTSVPLHFAEDQRTMSLLLQEPSSYCGSAADYGNHLQQIMWGFFHNGPLHGFAVDEDPNLCAASVRQEIADETTGKNKQLSNNSIYLSIYSPNAVSFCCIAFA